MTGVLRQFRSFDRPVRLLAVNQFSINVGFYMLMPYLAAHLSLEIGLAGWLVGLVLGVRNFAQQGMFLTGGLLADRFGYKPLIVAGCALRTVGFALLGLVDNVPALLVAAAATGFAGALFNPAVRAYVAADAGERRVEAFALFNVFYQAGILLGPLVGLVLTGVTFRLTCLVAAVVFAVLTVLQVRALPGRRAGDGERGGRVRDGVRVVLTNRRFLAFALTMIGSYVLSFQMYLALPLEARRLAGSEVVGTAVVGGLFAVSGVLAIAGQLRITGWCRSRWRPGRCLAVGLLLMGAAFLPPALTAGEAGGGWPVFVPLLVAAAALGLGVVVVFPFEMDTIVSLAGNRMVATHYGLYNTICGVGIAVGNLGTGAALDLARAGGVPWAPWVVLAGVGVLCAAGVHLLSRSGRLAPAPEPALAGVRGTAAARSSSGRPAGSDSVDAGTLAGVELEVDGGRQGLQAE
ncbi:Predicted arabinose efflux permease, MFS family [Amycolatopsis arida]|uniref:Predicted arabinose efflux permease, MFS family n=1 Tax=Amycolatopsis arida TaxID=587909 RepID=A0A1I5ZV50_9PSEU|nr:MFS transporter [Amycolatopsis arida]TDX89391.1 putative MFS family arabinose efflux permease [Amycolatopsis arida]SFQ60346.1 Predicted arabinose efflux permease, MFS family [Amycolatopsis arida]